MSKTPGQQRSPIIPRHRRRPLAASPAGVALMAVALLLTAEAMAADAPGPAASAQSHVLIVTGSPGTPLYARHHSDWEKRFQAYFASSKSHVVTLNRAAATSAGIKQKIAEFAAQLQPADSFVLIILGHGGVDGSVVLPGPDLPAKELADALSPLKAQSQVILNFTSSSGMAIKDLRRTGRILITATSPNQSSDSDFAEFFLLSLESSARRPASILDLFNKSSYQYAQWITRQRQTEEGWTVEGKTSLEIFKKLYTGDDVPASRRLAPSGSDATKEDPILPMVPDGKVEFWKGRRLVSEHPLLEDTGQSEGASAIGGDGSHPVEPKKDDDPGALAKRAFLGHPGAK